MKCCCTPPPLNFLGSESTQFLMVTIPIISSDSHLTFHSILGVHFLLGTSSKSKAALSMENSSWQERKEPFSQTSGICIVLLLLLATYSIPFCHKFFKYYSVYCVIGLSGKSAWTEAWTCWRPSLAPQISWNRKLSRLSGCYQVTWAVLPNIMS